MVELKINDKNAFSTWGVRMGDGFEEALSVPASPKEYVTNESRLEHGKQYLLKDPWGNSVVRMSSLSVTLLFTIEGKNEADLRAKRNSFYQELYNGSVDIEMYENGVKYHLIYTGRPQSYGHNLARTFCKIAVRFEEPNPMNRV